MAFNSHFTSELDGKSVNDLVKNIDYKKTKLKDRMENIENILESSEYYTEYFSEYYKPNINTSDGLSSDNNVCMSLERMANYILNSQEVKDEENKEKTKYVFHTDKKYFEKKIAREQSISQMIGSDYENDEEMNTVHLLKNTEQNSRKAKTQKITAEDLNRTDKLGEVLSDYNKFLDVIDLELKNKESRFSRYLLTKTKGAILQDMIYCKDQLLGVWGYHLKNFYESTEPDLNVFDFTNEEHLKGKSLLFKDKDGVERELKVKGLIYFQSELKPDDDFSLTIYDLNNLIKKINLTTNEEITLREIRLNQSNVAIAKMLEVSPKAIEYYINRIVEKIIKVGDKYDLK